MVEEHCKLLDAFLISKLSYERTTANFSRVTRYVTIPDRSTSRPVISVFFLSTEKKAEGEGIRFLRI